MVDDVADLGLQWAWDAGSPCWPGGCGQKVLDEANWVAGEGLLDGSRDTWIGEDGRGCWCGCDSIDVVIDLVLRGEEEVE